MIILTDRQYREILDRIDSTKRKLQELRIENSIYPRDMYIFDLVKDESTPRVPLSHAVFAIAKHLNLHLSAKRGEPEKAANIVLQPIPAQQPQPTRKSIKRNRKHVK